MSSEEEIVIIFNDSLVYSSPSKTVKQIDHWFRIIRTSWTGIKIKTGRD